MENKRESVSTIIKKEKSGTANGQMERELTGSQRMNLSKVSNKFKQVALLARANDQIDKNPLYNIIDCAMNF